jgi:CheY-like chemotaxis protein
MTATEPLHENARLKALHGLEILDTPAEPAFDRITRLVRNIFRVPMATISLVDKDRQWFKSRIGVAVPETPRSWSFCTRTILSNDVLVVPDALADARFVASPLMCGDAGIRFYAGAPLRMRDGHNLGSLCIMDTVARPDLDARQREILADLADVVVEECMSRRKEHELRAAKDDADRANRATGPTVLYIEDAVASIHLIRSILKRVKLRGGSAVRLISSMQGTLGLEMARVHAPDLILLDLHLPDLSGIQVLNQLKADARISSIPVVVLTADPLPGTQGQVRDAGALACLSKPLDVAQFLETVSHLLEATFA